MAATYTSCSLDLEHAGWSAGLLAAGFDPAVPAVWIAEGLVMYLSEAGVLNLMREAASISARGSRLLVMVGSLTWQPVRSLSPAMCTAPSAPHPPACAAHAESSQASAGGSLCILRSPRS
jgi:O-methyltransferase involved in polyketide biosynthesis